MIKAYDFKYYTGEDVSLPEIKLAVNGKDIMDILNIPQGKQVGDILKFLLDKVNEEPELNDKEKLLSLLGEYK